MFKLATQAIANKAISATETHSITTSLRGKVTTAEAIQKPTLPKEEIQKTLTASHLPGLPRYADATLAMTAAQSMNRDRLCHPELVSGSQYLGKPLRRLGFNPTSSNPRVTLNLFQGLKQCRAFSLVEMLMALLVASLLLAALAPVMTKRMDEAKINISGVGAAQYDKDSIISIYTGAEGEDKVFNVPNDVNMIKATLIGGGGAGGNSFYGKQEITTSKAWTVPAGVTKLRIFMLGGGGGGASGGLGTGTAYGDMPAIGSGTLTIKEPGEYAIADKVTPPSTYKTPALDEICKASGITKWTAVSDNTQIAPDTVPTKLLASVSSVTISKVTACGGGGGGGVAGGGGGSGGYLKDIKLADATYPTVFIKVGGGGGGYNSVAESGSYGAGGGGGGVYLKTPYGGGSGGTLGGDGGAGKNSGTAVSGSPGNGTALSYGGNGIVSAGSGGRGGVWGGGGGGGGANVSCNNQNGGGGGGGGPTTLTTAVGTSGTILFQVGGGCEASGSLRIFKIG